jgi:hypothetical protein
VSRAAPRDRLASPRCCLTWVTRPRQHAGVSRTRPWGVLFASKDEMTDGGTHAEAKQHGTPVGSWAPPPPRQTSPPAAFIGAHSAFSQSCPHMGLSVDGTRTAAARVDADSRRDVVRTSAAEPDSGPGTRPPQARPRPPRVAASTVSGFGWHSRSRESIASRDTERPRGRQHSS